MGCRPKKGRITTLLYGLLFPHTHTNTHETWQGTHTYTNNDAFVLSSPHKLFINFVDVLGEYMDTEHTEQERLEKSVEIKTFLSKLYTYFRVKGGVSGWILW